MKKYLTITEVAKALGLTREAVFYRIKTGKIEAEKAGNMFIITDKDIIDVLTKEVTEKKKKLNDMVVKRAVKEYSEVFKRLSKE